MNNLSTLRLSFGHFMAVLISLSATPYLVMGYNTASFRVQAICGFLAIVSVASGVAIYLFADRMDELDASDTEMAVKVREDMLERSLAEERTAEVPDQPEAWHERFIGFVASFVELLDPPAKHAAR